MDEPLMAQLQEAVAQESQAVTHCLVAAERAVEDGRFNIAKVMRAAAHTARIWAMHLQRLLTAQASPIAPVEVEQQRRHAQHIALAEALQHASSSTNEAAIRRLKQLQALTEPLLDILDRSVDTAYASITMSWKAMWRNAYKAVMSVDILPKQRNPRPVPTVAPWG